MDFAVVQDDDRKFSVVRKRWLGESHGQLYCAMPPLDDLLSALSYDVNDSTLRSWGCEKIKLIESELGVFLLR